jgi:hypothetical protein
VLASESTWRRKHIEIFYYVENQLDLLLCLRCRVKQHDTKHVTDTMEPMRVTRIRMRRNQLRCTLAQLGYTVKATREDADCRPCLKSRAEQMAQRHYHERDATDMTDTNTMQPTGLT